MPNVSTPLSWALLSGLAIWSAASPALGAPNPTHAAACVAALKSRAEPLAQRVREGDAAAEAELLPIVTESFAFIGVSYKQGLRSEQANELLKQAEAQQAKMPQAELVKVQDACQVEGRQLFAEASVIERLFVSRAAQSRVQRLKRPPQPAANPSPNPNPN